MFPLQPGTMETYTEIWTGSKYLISELLNIRYKIIKYRMPTKKIITDIVNYKTSQGQATMKIKTLNLFRLRQIGCSGRVTFFCSLIVNHNTNVIVL